MTKEIILLKLKSIKSQYEKEGLILFGFFGSYSKGTASKNSDIDILYDLDSEKFSSLNKGFTAFSRLSDIKEELKVLFKTNIDLCAKSGLSRTGEKYILKETIYV